MGLVSGIYSSMPGPWAKKGKKHKKQKAKRKEREIKRAVKHKVAAQYKQQLTDKATPAEMAFYRILKENDVEFQFQRIFLFDRSFCIVDFYLPKLRWAIEIDGGYHETEEQKNKDSRRAHLLRQKGIKKILRFTNEQVCFHRDEVEQILIRKIEPLARKQSCRTTNI